VLKDEPHKTLSPELVLLLPLMSVNANSSPPDTLATAKVNVSTVSWTKTMEHSILPGREPSANLNECC
jgi:hypothetical protein